jgi:hypothetical protein
MPTTPRLPQPTRSAAEARYRALRDAAFRAAGADLAVAGMPAELRAIDRSALVAAGEWSDRRVVWPWDVMAAHWRRNHPDRFELAVWRDSVLCGLALGHPAPAAAHVSLRYIERNPSSANPLRVANRNHRRLGSQSSDSRAQHHCNASEGPDPQSLQLGA